jgi:hypothetical protein
MLKQTDVCTCQGKHYREMVLTLFLNWLYYTYLTNSNTFSTVRSVAFPAAEYNEVLSGYQMGQVVEWWKNQCFEARNGLQNIHFVTI